MSTCRVLPLFFLPLLSTGLRASDGKTQAAPEGAEVTTVSNERGTPALFAWADYDGDSRLDLAAVSADGRLQLLRNDGEGRFEDVTERVGLAGVTSAALALWADYDGDGRLDLFVGVHAGASRLFHDEGGTFVDMSAGSGLLVEGTVRSAQWLDFDGDGRPDLQLVTAEESRLFRGLAGGFFEPIDLELSGAPAPQSSSGSASSSGRSAVELGAPPAAGSSGDVGPDRTARGPKAGLVSLDDLQPLGPRVALAPVPGSATPIGHFPLACASSIEDQASPGACLEASTTPVLGRLYPLSANFFVAVGGNVGIGTTSPTARLDVAGTARVADTLTLAPPGDVALDVATGSIYKGGALFLHTKGGVGSTALGRNALSSPSTGKNNTALGFQALLSNTTGYANTASGVSALVANTSGFANTASGLLALAANTIGYANTASGVSALAANTSGYDNTACGASALRANTTGSTNTATGAGALRSNTTGAHNTASGFHALYSSTIGSHNTASGFFALYSNTTGYANTACGSSALATVTSGNSNTAVGASALGANIGSGDTATGADALRDNTSGVDNTASGVRALRSNTTGIENTANGNSALFTNTVGYDNTAIGSGALYYNTTGSSNLALGHNAGLLLTTGHDNVDIANAGVAGESGRIRIGTAGNQTRTFIAGIRGVTTANANAIPVLVDSAGQLGTVSSSARFKEEIRDMADLTDRLLELRPVVFRYRPEVQAGERPLEYGLIAEEVAEVFPELVVYGDDGRPFTVKYHLLAAMLLNELEKLHARLADEDASREHELEQIRARLAALEGCASAALPR